MKRSVNADKNFEFRDIVKKIKFVNEPRTSHKKKNSKLNARLDELIFLIM